MRRRITLALLSVAAVLASFVVAASPAEAHGYISSPPSRQAMCAQGRVADCGDIIYEPQSVEAPKGSMLCNGGGSRFAVLNDETKNWPATSVGNTVTFTWTFTANHRTLNWEYFVGSTRIAVVDGNASQPPMTVSHTVNLGGRTGRIKLLARWNIYDTVNAFYSCVDLQVGTGPGPSPSPTPTASPTPSPSPSPSPTSSPPSSGTWAPYTAYAVGAVVTYNGLSYRCIQAHTSLPGWEPPNTPALWQRT
jgi:chitin-binding protein